MLNENVYTCEEFEEREVEWVVDIDLEPKLKLFYALIKARFKRVPVRLKFTITSPLSDSGHLPLKIQPKGFNK